MSVFDNWENRKDNDRKIAEWMHQNPDPAGWFTLYTWEEDKDPKQEQMLKDKLAQYHVAYTEKVQNVLNAPAAIDGIVGGEIDISNIDKIFSEYNVINGIPYYQGVPVPVYNAIVDEQLGLTSDKVTESYGDEDQNDLMHEIDK